MSGIYCIRNLATGKVYVGSSSNIKARLANHRFRLRAGRHDNSHLQRSWKRHGEASFVFEVLEHTEDLLVREQAWMDALRSADPEHGYNAGPADRPTLGRKRTLESRIAASRAMRGRPKPEHVGPMVAAANRARGAAAVLDAYWRSQGRRCKQKLTSADVRLIRERKARGESNAAIAADMKVDRSTISRSYRGVTHAAA